MTDHASIAQMESSRIVGGRAQTQALLLAPSSQKHRPAANASRYEKPNTFTTVTTTNATKATAIRMSLSEAGGIDESYEPSAIVRDGASALCVSATNGAGADILLRITSPSRLPIMGAATPAMEDGA